MNDLKFAFRQLLKNPVFTAVAVLTLSIGIGANTTVFSVAYGLLLRPPAVVIEPDRLIDIGSSRKGRGFGTSSYPNYLGSSDGRSYSMEIRSRLLASLPKDSTARASAEEMCGCP